MLPVPPWYIRIRSGGPAVFTVRINFRAAKPGAPYLFGEVSLVAMLAKSLEYEELLPLALELVAHPWMAAVLSGWSLDE